MKKVLLVLVAVLMLAAPIAHAQDDGGAAVFSLVTTDDGAFAMSYLPDGWVFDGDAGALLIASDATLFEDDSSIASGQLRMVVVPLSDEELATIAADRRSQFEALLAELTEGDDDDPVQLGEIQDYPEYGEGALYVYGADSQAESDVLFYPLAPGYWALSYIGTALGELATDWGNMGWDVLGGVFYSAPLDAPFEGQNFSFSLPAGWPVSEANAPVVYVIGNSEEALAAAELGVDDVYLLVGDVAGAGVDVATLSLSEEAVALATIILSEGEVLDEAFVLEINGGVQMGIVEIYDADGANVGGVVVAEMPDMPNAVYGVAYGTYAGRGIEVVYTAINVLMSLSVNVQ